MFNAQPLGLSGIHKTMLLTLYNRAMEADRPNGLIYDPECLRIFFEIDFNFEKAFGKPTEAHPMRSKTFDDALREWMSDKQIGTVVELGCGLETQYWRCANPIIRWICVDEPEAMEARELFIQPEKNCKHLRKSAFDFSWMDHVDPSRPVFISAQGLLMYFSEETVWALIERIFSHFPDVVLMFDVIPRWFSKKTMSGLAMSAQYVLPKMPWGCGHTQLERAVSARLNKSVKIKQQPYGYIRGTKRIMLEFFGRLPIWRNFPPRIVTLTKNR